MKSQFAGIILFSLILVFVVSFGHINTSMSLGTGDILGPENLMLTTAYYVDCSGGDDDTNNGLSSGSAWETLDHAMSVLDSVDGYTLYIMAGTYIEPLVVKTSDTSSLTNTITNYDNDLVTINASGYNYGIDINGESNIDISNITVTSATYDGVKIRGSVDSVVLDSITVSSVGSTYSAISVDGTDSNNYPNDVTISNCELSGSHYGISVTDYCEEISIGENTITGGSQAGVYISSYCDSGSIHYNDISIPTCENAVKIDNNCESWYITNNDIKITTSGTNGIYLYNMTNPVLFNNFVLGSFSNSLVYDKDTTNLSMNYNSLRNLTSVLGVKGYYGERTNSNPLGSFHNNIFALADTTYGSVMYIAGTANNWIPATSTDISNNLYFNGLDCAYIGGDDKDTIGEWQTAISADADSYRTNPLFVTTPANDLHLQSTSPCFAKAISISGISTDKDGNTRNESKPCIGADELTSLSISGTFEFDWSHSDLDITVENGGNLSFDGSSSSLEMNLGNLTIASGGNLTIEGDVLVKAELISISGTVTVGDVETVIRAIDLTVNSGGTITSNGQGYAAGAGPGAGGDSTNNGAGGGAFGGNGATGGPGVSDGTGGLVSSYTTEDLYYFPYQDTDATANICGGGSGGGSGNGTVGGSGGGVIKITVFDDLTNNGTISANGNAGGDGSSSGETGAGGGAGGGIYIQTNNLIGSTGTITANGGNGGIGFGSVKCGGAGGGGRIALYYRSNTFTGTITSSAGTSYGDCYNLANDGTKLILELPYFNKKKICKDSGAPVLSGLFGNESINLIDRCLTTEYTLTHLAFNESLSRNFELYYGSMNGLSNSTSPIGSAGWTHSFNENLDLSNISNDEISYMLLCGVTVKYIDVDDNDTNYEVAPFYGVMPDIVYDSGADEYTMTFLNGNVKTFDNEGKWISYTDVSGKEMTLLYDQDERLSSVEFPDDRYLEITYDGQTNFINTIICYDSSSKSIQIGSTISFDYDSNELTDIGYWEFEYNNGKLWKQNHEYASSTYCTTEFTVDSNGVCTQITDSLENSKSFTRSDENLLDNISVVQGKNGAYHYYEIDPLFNIKTAYTNPSGNTWDYIYDLKRMLFEISQPENTGSAPVVYYDEHEEEIVSLFPKTVQDYNDANTELSSIKPQSGLLNTPLTINPYTTNSNSKLTWTKNSNGQILTETITQLNSPYNYTFSENVYDSEGNLTYTYGPVENETVRTTGNLLKTEIKYEYKINNITGSGNIVSDGTTSISGVNTNFDGEIEVGDTITASSTSETRTVTSITDDYNLTINQAFTGSFGCSYEINKDYELNHRVRRINRKTGSTTNIITMFYYDANLDLVKRIDNYSDVTNQRITEYEYCSTTSIVSGTIKNNLSKVKIYVSAGVYLETQYEYYGIGSIKRITDPTGLVTEFVIDNYGNTIKSCSDPNGEMLGSEYTYNSAGTLVLSVKSGKWSAWDVDGTCTFDTISLYTQTDYAYNNNLEQIATKNRADIGYVTSKSTNSVYETTVIVRKGKVNNFSTTPSIDTSEAYSEDIYIYDLDSNLIQTKKLLSGTTYAIEENEYLSNGNIAKYKGPEYGSTSDRPETQYEYDYTGKLVRTSDKITSSSYSENERIYDAFGRLSELIVDEGTNKLNLSKTYQYNDYTGIITDQIIDEGVTPHKNLKTSYTFNDFGQTTMITYAAQSTNNEQLYRFSEYDQLGRLIREYLTNDSNDDWDSDDIVNKVQYEYDNVGRLYKKTNYDIVDNTDVDVEYIFDSLNRTKAICIDPNGLKEGVIYTYNSIGQISRVDEVQFSAFNQTYGSYTVNSYLRARETVYDNVGRVQYSVHNPIAGGTEAYENIKTYYEYDELNRVEKVYNPDQMFISSGVIGNAKHSQYYYDNASRLTKIEAHVGVNGGTTQTLAEFTYFNSGSRNTMVYYQSATPIYVTYDYYPTGALKSTQYPGYNGDPDLYQYEYNANGALTRIYHGDVGDLFDYSYDTAGRLTSIEERGSNQSVKQFVYNDRSQVTQIQDYNGDSRYEFSYDEYARVESTTDKTYNIFDGANSKTIDYTYYKSGLRKEMETPDYKLQYDYDNAGRLVEIDRDDNNTWVILSEYTYNSLGQRTGYSRYNDSGTLVLQTLYDYLDDVGWLTRVRNLDENSNTVSSYQYYETNEGDKHDALGNRLYMKYTNGSYNEYEYDDYYRLSSETRYNNTPTQIVKFEYTYDHAGNRKTQSRYTSSGTWDKYIEYTYNNANQLITQYEWQTGNKNTQTKEIKYAYDDLGNLVSKDLEDDTFSGTPAYDDFHWDYEYDNYNRLNFVYENNDSTNNKVGEYVFNMMGNRVQKKEYNSGGTLDNTINMLYDRYDCVADYDDSDELQRYYITPFMDENMVMNVASSGTPSDDYFYAQDGLGTVGQIVDSSGTVQNSYDYEGFGTSTGTSGSLYNRFRYTGREYDAETEDTFNNDTGEYYYRARTYDSTIGSFTSRDPMNVRNLYPYSTSNPINFTDPTGKIPLHLSKEEREEWDRDLDLRTEDERRDFRTNVATLTSINNCKCAEDYVKCLVGKVNYARNQLSLHLSIAIQSSEKGEDPSNFVYTADLIRFLNEQYSFFDTNPISGYEGATSFDYNNSTHIAYLKILQLNLWKIGYRGIMEPLRFDCESGRKFRSGVMAQISDDRTYIRLNLKYLCKEFWDSNYGSYYKNNGEKINAHSIVHELTHLAFGSEDFGTPYNGIYLGNKRYSSLGINQRINHADTYTRLIMRYFPDIPECKIDNKLECCFALGEFDYGY